LILAPLSLQLPPLSLLLSDESVPLASLLSLVLLNEEAPPSLIASNIREDNNKFTANFEPPSPLAYLESLAMESVANNSFDWNKNNNVTANFDQPSAKSLSAQSSILPSAAAAAAAAAVLPSSSSASSASTFDYDFDPTHQLSRQQIVLPRKDPKQERTLLRRMETKTIQLSIFYSHDQTMSPQEKSIAAKKEAAAAAAAVASKKKSWFFGGGGKSNNSRRERNKSELSSEHNATNNDKDTFLGKVTIEFNQLLSRGCITGDYPIMTNAKSLGGILRVAIRTKSILDPDRYEGVTTVSSSSSLSTSVYKDGVTFTFHNTDKDNDVGDKKTSSVATMKTKSVSSSLSPQSSTPPQTMMTTTATRTSTTTKTKSVGVMQLHETRLLP